jgi:acyl dehydratase
MDVNPIHLHAIAAKAFGFPRAIAHGMYTAARAFSACQELAQQDIEYVLHGFIYTVGNAL